MRLTGDRQGVVTDDAGTTSVEFTGVGEVGGAGADTYVVDGPASLAILTLDADDRLVIDGSVGSAAADVLTVTALSWAARSR